MAPILSGFLLEAGLREWISLVSAVCFVAAIIFTQQIEVSSQKLISFSASWRFFRRHFLSLQRRGGFLADAVQTGTLLYVWPIFFHFVVGSFTLMGIFVSAAAVAEMISTQFFGRFVDRKSPQRSLRWAAVARAFDIGIRGGLLWVPHVAMVAVVQGVSGILGPLFNIAFYTRVSEMAEKDSSKSLTFYVTREWSLAVGRTLVLLFSAFLVWMGGAEMLVVSLFLAAVFSAWFRRF
ncbi:MAG: hypothetical protein K9M51_01795 [Candidatus Gracilibacteria bacterium]|nr:hypothetical protein [Candidatus Gracilibacteria bacterium]